MTILLEEEEAVVGRSGSCELVALLEKEKEMICERGFQGSFSSKENKTRTLTSKADLEHVGLDLLS